MRRSFLVMLLAMLAATASAQMPQPLRDRSSAAAVPPIIRDKGGRVLDVAKGPGGMTVYTVEKDGKPVIFYVTPDGAAALVGVMFDAKTGANLSESFLEHSYALIGRDPKPKADVVIVNQVAQHLASPEVVGVVEGKAEATKTTFVFFDPRCPYCHNLFANTREQAKRGANIKWIPVNTLGEPGVPISAAILRKGKPALVEVMAGHLKDGVPPTMDERAKIEANTVLFGAIVRQLGKKPATPTFLFQDGNGKLTVVQDDGSNKVALTAAFGKAR